MIIANIIGGLGNQMFQYAAARALSQTRQQPLFLDISDFEDYRLHRFELMRIFDCHADIANAPQVREMLGWRAGRKIRKLLRRPRFGWLSGSRMVVEPHFHYWGGLFDAPDDCYLSGYWQSERYFSDIAQTIRQDFVFKYPLAGENAELSERIAACNAVSLHIRRGDYVTDARTRNVLQPCPLDYYRKSIAFVAEKVPSPCFFIFSDDIAWSSEHLKNDFPCIYVGHNRGGESYRDMQLMSLCRHNIIANSSFSWWGAWLNSNPGKIVVAPKHWFSNQTDARDLIPHEWTTL